MIGKLFDKLLGSTLGKGATIIGSIITVKWGGDMVGDFFDNRVKARKRNEAIDRIILTEEDKEYFKKMVEKKGQTISTQEMKELKHDIINGRKKQTLYRKESKIEDMFSEDYKSKNKKNKPYDRD